MFLKGYLLKTIQAYINKIFISVNHILCSVTKKERKEKRSVLMIKKKNILVLTYGIHGTSILLN